MLKISTLKHLAYLLNVGISKKELLALCSDCDKYYYEMFKYKLDENGNIRIKDYKPEVRKLTPSMNILEKIQNAINRKILVHLPVSPHAYAYVKGRDNIQNAQQHKGKKIRFKTDIMDFYPSITLNKVYRMFIQNGMSADVSKVLTRLCTYQGNLPQGTHTSPTIANLVMLNTDNSLSTICNQYGITYTRYSDDLVFSRGTDFKDITSQLVSIIYTSGFHLNHKKTKYCGSRMIITGIDTGNNTLRPLSASIKKLERFQSEGNILAYNGLNNYHQRIRN